MKIVVIGIGHIGLVTAATLSNLGHDVVGFDDDADRVACLNAGGVPFFEEGLQDFVDRERASGRLRFSPEAADAIPGTEVAFICVGTPGRPGGSPNLLAMERASSAVAKWATRDMVVVEKSTVPVRTAEQVRAVLSRAPERRFDVALNPEFLREGKAVEDSLHPDRLLVGADSARSHEVMRQVYGPMIEQGVRYFATDLATAELAKHACNAFLSLKISFINGVARVCEAAGADVVAIADIMGADPRIGRAFLNAGIGYGGFCFPKDLAAFRAQSEHLGYHFRLLDEIAAINDEALGAVFAKIQDACWNVEQKRIVLLGLAFKPGTDDVRDSPALRLAERLIEAGANVIGYDPKAGPAAAAALPALSIAGSVEAAAEGADCLVVCTEWPEFRDLDLTHLKGMMAVPVLVDGRNLFEPETAAEAGFTYLPTGRPSLSGLP